MERLCASAQTMASLSDRIMSRYGDTANGMVESAMEFLRIARSEDYHNIILSMKSSNPHGNGAGVPVADQPHDDEFGECYPLHLGVTEAGDGEDGRIKSAIGIGTLLEDGIGDTIRVSLTEDPELEIPVCQELVKRYTERKQGSEILEPLTEKEKSLWRSHNKRTTFAVSNIGSGQVPVVVADMSKGAPVLANDLEDIGYRYDAKTDKWSIGDMAPDYLFFGNKLLNFDLPGSLKVIQYFSTWKNDPSNPSCFPIFDAQEYLDYFVLRSLVMNFVMVDCFSENYPQGDLDAILEKLRDDPTAVICLSSVNVNVVQSIRKMFLKLQEAEIANPVIILSDSNDETMDESLIHYAVETGALLLEGMGDGISLGYHFSNVERMPDTKLMNSIAFGILQATRKRISKTEYISCPSCGRTLFDLQETTARIRAVTNHLKGVKIAIMGCIVNGPGEMADADFGYVGSGPGKITLYKGKEVMKRGLSSEVAVDELISLIKENGAWQELPGMVDHVA